VSLNSVARMGSGKVTATLSGGLTFERMSGTLQPLAFTTYRLGGHSVLFEDDFLLAASLEPTSAVGFNLGGDVSFSVHRGVAVMVGYRYRGGPAIDMPVRVTSVINADQIVFEQTLAEITQQLAPRPAHVDLSGSRLVIGLKLMR
jgi:opacity protein-like surface antigen